MPSTENLSDPPTPKILIIDDEVAVLHLLRTLLGRLHYDVTAAGSANEALSHLERDTYDCIVTDAVMPDVSGYDFVKIVRSNPLYATLPILMLTRKRHREDVKKAVEVGVTDYVLKPIDEDLLLEKIELCLKKSAAPPVAHELPVSGSLAEAEVGVGCRIASLGEASMTLRLQYRLEQYVPFRVHGSVFAEIGIAPPNFKLESCEMKTNSDTDPDFAWEAIVSFEEIPEADVAKIRDWIQRQSTQPGK